MGKLWEGRELTSAEVLKLERACLFRETLRKCYRTLIFLSLSKRQMLEFQVQVRSCLLTRKS